MKRTAIGLALALMGAGTMFLGPAAQACTSAGASASQSCFEDATLSVTVNTAVTLTFSDNTAAFGAQNPGTTTTQLDTLSYTLETNNIAAAPGPDAQVAVTSRGITGGGLGTGGMFELSNDNGTNWYQVNSTVDSAVGPAQWSTANTNSPASFQDDARVTLGTNVLPGARTATVRYTASTIV